MPRRPAIITPADVARVIRAAKQEGAAEVEIYVGEQLKMVIRINQSISDKIALAEFGEIVL